MREAVLVIVVSCFFIVTPFALAVRFRSIPLLLTGLLSLFWVGFAGAHLVARLLHG